MSRGPGKVQTGILEYLRARMNEKSEGGFEHNRKVMNRETGWCFASNAILRSYYPLDEWANLSAAQYSAGMRAIDRLVKAGLIERAMWRQFPFGKRRGPYRRFEFCLDDKDDGLGLIKAMFIKSSVSVETNSNCH